MVAMGNLVGHLIDGLILAAVYAAMTRRARAVAHAQHRAAV